MASINLCTFCCLLTSNTGSFNLYRDWIFTMLNFQNSYQNRLLLLALLLHNYVKCYTKGGKSSKSMTNSKEAASIIRQTIIDEDFARHICDVLVSYGIKNRDSTAELPEPPDCYFNREDSLYMVRNSNIEAQHRFLLNIYVLSIGIFWYLCILFIIRKSKCQQEEKLAWVSPSTINISVTRFRTA